MSVAYGASVPCSFRDDFNDFLLVNDSEKQMEQLKPFASVYCFALSQLLSHHLRHGFEPSQQKILFLEIVNSANSPEHDKRAGQAAKFYWGTVHKKLSIAEWVLTVNFDRSKDFNNQPCTLEKWTCHKSYVKEDALQVFGHKRCLDVTRLLYMLEHPLSDFDKLFPVLERAERFITRFGDVTEGCEPWISESSKK